jgi:4-methyl-5(b-hydroxyethyl)-thiazole monophosphate biosynthesis
MIYVFLAEGFEEIEALAPVDILRRAGVEVKTVSITEDYIVTGAHGIPVMADTTIFQTADSVPGGWNDAQRLGECDMIVLPGGLPGSTNLDACQRLKEMIRVHYDAGRPLAAICAAPLVYGHMGILAGKRVTCYPGVEKELSGAVYTAALVEEDGQFITGCGPAAAMEFGYRLAARFVDEDTVQALREGMRYNQLKAEN